MAKRIKSMRDSTKEGIFGSIPYSFMTASFRSRYTSSFIVSVVRAFYVPFFTYQKCITCFWERSQYFLCVFPV